MGTELTPTTFEAELPDMGYAAELRNQWNWIIPNITLITAYYALATITKALATSQLTKESFLLEKEKDR